MWGGFTLVVSRECEGRGQEAGGGCGEGVWGRALPTEGTEGAESLRTRVGGDELREQGHEGQGMDLAVQWGNVPQLSVTPCAEDGQEGVWPEAVIRPSARWLGLGGGGEKWF